MEIIIRLVIVLFFFWSGICYGATDFNYSAYLKSFVVNQRAQQIDKLPTSLDTFKNSSQSQNAGRFMAEIFTGDTIAWQVHYEIIPVFYSHSQESQLFGESTLAIADNHYRLSDVKTSYASSDSKQVIHQNLDRFNVQWRLAAGDLTIGRQVISLGSARIINPSDVFLPFNVTTLNQEYRTGIDMIRFQKPLGNLGELDLGIVLGESAQSRNSAGFAKAHFHWRAADIAVTLIRFADQNLLGFGLESALGSMGFWFETAYVWGDDNYLRTSMGLDYAFTARLFAQLEYHYNGAGSSNPHNYSQLMSSSMAYRKGGVFLLGQDYLIPTLAWTASPLLTLSMAALVNVKDESVFFNLSGAYSLADELGLGFGGYLFAGDKLVFSPSSKSMPNQASASLHFQSEYGAYSNLAYISISYYF